MAQLLRLLMEDRQAARAESQATIAALQNIAQLAGGNNNNGGDGEEAPRSKLRDFQNTNPPVFTKCTAPLDADDWLRTIENNLEVAAVGENEKVVLATHFLAGPARAWWENVKANVVADALSREPCSLNARLKMDQPLLYQEFEEFGLELVSHGFLATLEVKPTLQDQIKEAQKGHESIEGIKRRMDKEEVAGFSIDEEGVLWYNGRLCVPSIPELKHLIMDEAHNAPYSIHPGGSKMYQDLKEIFWWHGMKRDIAFFIARCDVCQRVKAEHQRPAGLLQPLKVPTPASVAARTARRLDARTRLGNTLDASYPSLTPRGPARPLDSLPLAALSPTRDWPWPPPVARTSPSSAYIRPPPHHFPSHPPHTLPPPRTLLGAQAAQGCRSAKPCSRGRCPEKKARRRTPPRPNHLPDTEKKEEPPEAREEEKTPPSSPSPRSAPPPTRLDLAAVPQPSPIRTWEKPKERILEKVLKKTRD
ncbi:hypothetical protein QYE76_044231 [Lolium multiflorum]|uniref:Integrase zinc-binding domain-containing protein n=1 Tax=Lolium multiflorum TaxID=4521 RepID=A0AAD8TK92_LOLMU|nr:hypothetical protein QYE76_044231 [Lolium multiflorum]